MASLERAPARTQNAGSTQTHTDEMRAQRAKQGLRQAQAALRRGRKVAALGHFQSVYRLCPLAPPQTAALAELAFKLSRFAECITLLAPLAQASPPPSCVLYLGRAYLRNGQPQLALPFLERAITTATEDPQLWHDLATAYLHTGATNAAIMGYQEVVRRAPASGEAHYNLGTTLLAAGRAADALSTLTQAVKRSPKHAQAHLNLGIAWKELGDIDRAYAAQRAAHRLAPTDAEISWNLALTELLRGDLPSGFKRFEARLNIKGHPLARFAQWDGRDEPQRPVLVVAEQGLGDTLQFLRFLDAAADRCAALSLACQPCLLPLLRSCYRGRAQLEAIPPDPAERRLIAPLMSLPLRLGMTTAISAAAPYLHLNAEKVAGIAASLPTRGLNVGLCWQGNPAYRADHRRSLHLQQLAPLAAVPEVHFISLQHGKGREQLDHWPGPIQDWGQIDEKDAAFVETAHALGALDLLITTDTAVAHLAGALGTPVWLLLAHIPDFRWGLTGNRWYPTMRLFRQRAQDAWPAVIEDVRAELQRLTDGEERR